MHLLSVAVLFVVSVTVTQQSTGYGSYNKNYRDYEGHARYYQPHRRNRNSREGYGKDRRQTRYSNEEYESERGRDEYGEHSRRTRYSNEEYRSERRKDNHKRPDRRRNRQGRRRNRNRTDRRRNRQGRRRNRNRTNRRRNRQKHRKNRYSNKGYKPKRPKPKPKRPKPKPKRCSCYSFNYYTGATWAFVATVTAINFTPHKPTTGYNCVVVRHLQWCKPAGKYTPAARLNTPLVKKHAFSKLKVGDRRLFYGSYTYLAGDRYRRAFLVNSCGPPCKLVSTTYSCPLTANQCKID